MKNLKNLIDIKDGRLKELASEKQELQLRLTSESETNANDREELDDFKDKNEDLAKNLESVRNNYYELEVKFVEKQKENLKLKQELRKNIETYPAEEILKNATATREVLKNFFSEFDAKSPMIPHLEKYSNWKSQPANLQNSLKEVEDEMKDQRKMRYLAERNVKRLQKTVRDLNCQIQFLMNQVEDTRENPLYESEAGLTKPLVAEDVITQHLVKFKNIEELQEKNQQLLLALHEVSDQVEEKELELASEKIAKAMLMMKLDTATAQRDAKQVLLFSKGLSKSDIEDGENFVLPLLNQIKDLKIELDDNKNQKEFLQSRLDHNNRETSRLAIANAELASQVEYLEEAAKIVEINAAFLKDANDTYTAILRNYCSSTDQNVRTIDCLREELAMAHRRILDQDILDIDKLRKKLEIKFKVGEEVAVRNYKKGKPLWRKGIIQSLDRYDCTVIVGGQRWQRNMDQLRHVIFAEPKTRQDPKRRKVCGGPYKTFLLSNVFDKMSRESGPTWAQDILSAVSDECQKFGGATNVIVDELSEGNVFVRAPTVSAAIASVTGLHGKWFSGRLIAADYVPESMFPDS